MTTQTSKYPEHEKLAKVSDQSNLIGEFLDFGLSEMGIVLYEERTYDCECDDCDAGLGASSRWHSEKERETAKDGRVQITKMFPTQQTIQQILAKYFDIDQKKIDKEKDEMLKEIRGKAS